MKVSDMHKMRLQAEAAKRGLSKKPRNAMAKEIELRREEMIREILQESKTLIQQQVRVALLEVHDEGKNNDTVLKASTALLDRAFGKPKESIDFTGNVQFSLKELAQKRLEVNSTDVTPLEDMI